MAEQTANDAAQAALVEQIADLVLEKLGELLGHLVFTEGNDLPLKGGDSAKKLEHRLGVGLESPDTRAVPFRSGSDVVDDGLRDRQIVGDGSGKGELGHDSSPVVDGGSSPTVGDAAGAGAETTAPPPGPVVWVAEASNQLAPMGLTRSFGGVFSSLAKAANAVEKSVGRELEWQRPTIGVAVAYASLGSDFSYIITSHTLDADTIR